MLTWRHVCAFVLCRCLRSSRIVPCIEHAPRRSSTGFFFFFYSFFSTPSLSSTSQVFFLFLLLPRNRLCLGPLDGNHQTYFVSWSSTLSLLPLSSSHFFRLAFSEDRLSYEITPADFYFSRLLFYNFRLTENLAFSWICQYEIQLGRCFFFVQNFQVFFFFQSL